MDGAARRRSRAAFALTGKGFNDGNDHRGDGQGPARDDRRGMMDCKQALTETNGDMEAAIDWLRKKGLSKAAKKAGRVAAEGLIGARDRGHQGRRGRGQFRDRLRRAQRAVPGPGQDDRAGRAQRRRRRREDQGRQGRRRHRRDRDHRRDRHHRREHDAAPRASLVGRQGRGVELRPQRGDRGRRQDGRDRRAGIRRQGRRACALGRQLAMHVAPPIRRRSIRPGSIRPS
jgi:hypothetical protein